MNQKMPKHAFVIETPHPIYRLSTLWLFWKGPSSAKRRVHKDKDTTLNKMGIALGALISNSCDLK